MNDEKFKALMQAIDKIQDDKVRNEVLQALYDYQAVIANGLRHIDQVLNLITQG